MGTIDLSAYSRSLFPVTTGGQTPHLTGPRPRWYPPLESARHVIMVTLWSFQRAYAPCSLFTEIALMRSSPLLSVNPL